MKKLLFAVLILFSVFCSAEEYPLLSVPEAPACTSAALWRAIDHVLGRYPAKVELSYTKDCLIIRCSGAVEKILSGKGDGPYAVFRGCTAEIFLQPDLTGPDYYQFAVSPDNRLYQAKGWDCLWKPAVPLKTETDCRENFWYAEFKIPFAALGRTTPRKGEKWKANFVFGKSWSPASDYHDPSQFGTIIFGADIPRSVEVDEFTFKDGNLSLSLTNHGTSSAKLQRFNGSGEIMEMELQPGKTMSVRETTKPADTHKNIHKFGVRITQDGKTYSFSGLASVANPDNAGLEKFYYAPGELPEHPEKGEFCHGNATVSVQAKEFFNPAQQILYGKLILKNGHFEIAGWPYYPVAGTRHAPLKIVNCLSSSFTRQPVAGTVFDEEPKIADHVFAQAEKTKEPALFCIQYESQLTVLTKGTDGKIRMVPDQIAFYEKVYKRLKKLYPEAVFSIQADGTMQRRERIARCCDVFEYACYGSSYAPALMAYLEDDLDSLLADAKDKPVLFYLGCFKSGGATRSAEELRAAVFLSMIKGCAGNILHLGHGGLPKEDTHARDLVANIQQEVDSCYAGFIRGNRDATREYRISDGKTEDSIRYAVSRLEDGTDLIIAVNTSASAGEMRIFHRNRLVRGPEKMAPYGVRILYLSQSQK